MCIRPNRDPWPSGYTVPTSLRSEQSKKPGGHRVEISVSAVGSRCVQNGVQTSKRWEIEFSGRVVAAGEVENALAMLHTLMPNSSVKPRTKSRLSRSSLLDFKPSDIEQAGSWLLSNIRKSYDFRICVNRTLSHSTGPS